MEYENYKVPKEERLEDIAKQFGLTVKELQELNPRMKIFKNFWGTEIYVVVNQIIKIPIREEESNLKFNKTKSSSLLFDETDRDRNEKIDFDFQEIYDEQKKEESKSKYFTFIWGDNAYKIDISTDLYVLGKSFGKNITTNIWNIQWDKVNTIQIDVVDKINIKIDGQLKPILDIVDKINKATSKLKLKLNINNSFEKVLEINDILNKWEKIKFEELKFYELEDDYFKKIIIAYDQEFKKISESISHNILYQIFLYPQALVKYPMYNQKLICENICTISQLFPKQIIKYNLFYTSKLEENKIKVHCTTSVPNDWDKGLIFNEYNKNYAGLIQEKFDFKFSLEVQYLYNEDNTLRYIKAYVKEQANKDLFYISEYTFTQMKKSYKK